MSDRAKRSALLKLRREAEGAVAKVRAIEDLWFYIDTPLHATVQVDEVEIMLRRALQAADELKAML